MPYTTTAKGFIERQLPALMTDGSPLRKLACIVKFAIEGQDGGTWYANFATGTISGVSEKVDVIVRARPRDFMAVIEGRMSPQDGMLTGRLHLAGDLAKIANVMGALRHA